MIIIKKTNIIMQILLQFVLALMLNFSGTNATQLKLNENFLLLGDFNAISLYDNLNTINLTSSNGTNSIYELSRNSDVITKLTTQNLPGTPLIWYPIDNSESLMVIDNKPYIYNTNSTSIEELANWSDINGEIKTVYYDSKDSILYLGGSLSYNETYGAVQYDYLSEQLVSLPFGGFNENSLVNTIIKEEYTENILFGGSFDSIGYVDFLNITVNETSTNTTRFKNDSSIIDISQKIPILASDVTATAGQNAANIICPTEDGNGWTLPNGEVGSWSAVLKTVINPSKLRLYNSPSNSHGVKTFRVITYPANGIMNLSYIDPTDLALKTCNAFCPLFLNSDVEDGFTANNVTDNTYYTFTNNNQTILQLTNKFQDFAFVNSVDVDSFTIQIMDYYGDYAELIGVEMSGTGINVYANDELNQLDSCATSNALDINVSSESIGSAYWLSSVDNSSMYTTVSTDRLDGAEGMRFNFQLAVSGQYNVLMYTNGCLDDNSCSNRGIVNVTLYDSNGEALSNNIIYQTNQYKKYDVLYTGRLEVANLQSTPMYVEMTVVQSLNDDNVYAVADSIQLQYIQLDLDEVISDITRDETTQTNKSIQINGLFEYSVSNFSSSMEYPIGNTTFNLLGSLFDSDAVINQLLINDTSLVVAGLFDSIYGDNIFGARYKTHDTQLNITDYFSVGNGSNGAVDHIYGPVDEFAIFGNFNKFATSSSKNDGAVLFNAASGSMDPMNIEDSQNITTVSGFKFNNTEFLALSYNDSSDVYDFTYDKVFTNTTTLSINIVSALDSKSEDWLTQESFNKSFVVGSITKFDVASNNIVQINNDTLSPVIKGINASLNIGVYIDDDTYIVGGSALYFLSNDSLSLLSENLLFSSGSEVESIMHYDDTLFFSTNGSAAYSSKPINGLAAYNINTSSLTTLNETFYGSINALAIEPQFGHIIGAGSFSVGECNSLCVFSDDSEVLAVNKSVSDVSGQITSLNYYNAYKVLIAGDFTYDGSTSYIGVYNTNDNDITILSNFSSQLSGPVNKFVFAEADKEYKSLDDLFIVQGSDYIGFFNDSKYTSISDSLNFASGELTDVSLIDTSSDAFFFGDKVLIATGKFSIENYGIVSSGIWDGRKWTPYSITATNHDVGNAKVQAVVCMTSSYVYQGTFTTASNTPTAKPSSSQTQGKNLEDFTNGQVAGVGFALALATILLLSAIGFAYYFLSGSTHKESLEGLKLDADDKMV